MKFNEPAEDAVRKLLRLEPTVSWLTTPRGQCYQYLQTFFSTYRLYISVNYAVICNLLLTRQLSSVIYVKTSVVDNIGPSRILALTKSQEKAPTCCRELLIY
jgi:hypothetical protein